MRAAIARGEIDKFPCGGGGPFGRLARGLPPRSKDRNIAKAQRIVEREMAKAKTGKAVVATDGQPWAEMSKAEKLGVAVDLGLDRTYEILSRPVDMGDLRQAQLIANTALAVISNQVRIDVAALSVSAPSPREARELTASEFDELLLGAEEPLVEELAPADLENE